MLNKAAKFCVLEDCVGNDCFAGKQKTFGCGGSSRAELGTLCWLVLSRGLRRNAVPARAHMLYSVTIDAQRQQNWDPGRWQWYSDEGRRR
eukprot:136575-Pleurochrysis_carterae.AAC.1